VRLDPGTARSLGPWLVFGFEVAQLDVHGPGRVPLLPYVARFENEVRACARFAFAPHIATCRKRLVQQDDASWERVLTRYPLRDDPGDLGSTTEPLRFEVVNLRSLLCGHQHSESFPHRLRARARQPDMPRRVTARHASGPHGSAADGARSCRIKCMGTATCGEVIVNRYCQP
jgi:hypothetical protein